MMEDRFFCFICTNELDIKREPRDSAASAAGQGSASEVQDQHTYLLPRNLDFICELLGLRIGADQRKLNNLVPESYKQVNYCCGCTRILLTLRDILEQLNSLTKRLNEFKEIVHQLLINAVPNELIDGWTKKLRNFLIQAINKRSNANPASGSDKTITILGPKPNPIPNHNFSRINSCVSNVSELENEPQSPDFDPEWFPESNEENFLNPDPEIQNPQDPFAITPCCVRLTKIRVSQTSPTTYIILQEALSRKRRGRSLVLKNVSYENDQKLENISKIRHKLIGTRVTCHYLNCNVSFSATHPELLNVHIRRIHEGKDKPYACGQCLEEFATLLQLRKHRIKLKHRKPKESSKFKEKSQRARIKIQRIFIGRRVNCHFPNCNASFSAFHREFLIAHIRRIHEGKDKPYACGRCSEEFTTSLQLRKHRIQLKHNKRKEKSKPKEKRPSKKLMSNEFKCTCGRFFVSKIVLEHHLTRQGGTCKNALGMGCFIDSDKRLVCGVCTKKYTCRKGLSKHLVSHTNGKNHICEFCGACFKGSDGLYAHKRRLHTQAYVEMHPKPDKAQELIQKLKCQICGKISMNPLQAKSHELTHKTNEFLVHCPECNRGFKYANALKFHMLNHKPKGFKCDQCGKEFARNDKLRVHIQRVHQNVRKVTCEYCTKPFFDKTALKRHIEILHEKPTKENQFHCLPCGKSFTTKDYLGIHQKTRKHKAAVDHINSLE